MGSREGGPDSLLKRVGFAGSETDRVRFLGPVPNNVLPLYYSAADVLAVPSLHEAFPKVVLEGMACETPVIATNVGGIPEVVSEGVNGLLVPPADSDALTSALLRLLRDDALRRRLGVGAAKTIATSYGWNDIAKELRSVYCGINVRA